MLAQFKANQLGNMHLLTNVPPAWDEGLLHRFDLAIARQLFALDFHGRVKETSSYNFQLMQEGDDGIGL